MGTVAGARAQVMERGRQRALARTAPSTPTSATNAALAPQHAAVLALQRSAGNRAVAQLLPVQRWSDQARGSRGIKVRMIQRLLNRASLRASLIDDGIFGPKTLAAVKDFQRMLGAKPTGIVTATTWAALQAEGRGSTSDGMAVLRKGVMVRTLASLAQSLMTGADRIAKATDATQSRQALVRTLVAAHTAYRLLLTVAEHDRAFTVKQRRALHLLRELVFLDVLLTGTLPGAHHPPPLADKLQEAGFAFAVAAISLNAQPPEKFAAQAPQVMLVVGKLLTALTHAVRGGRAAAVAAP